MKNLPKVTFGIINCNRLYYLKSCLESLLYCTEDYPNKEIILIDNASTEEGTEEYLKEKEKQGVKVIRQEQRDPSNEFAKALNIVAEEATGDFICPLQGDVQFVIKGGWLKEYVEFYQQNVSRVGSILLDAQRNTRNARSRYRRVESIEGNNFKFLYDHSRPPASGAGDVFYSKEVVELMAPWHIQNKNHEGGQDSETEMLMKIESIVSENRLTMAQVVPVIPVSCIIHTDFRGTNARVRNNKRYGDYWQPESGYKYYKIHDYEEIVTKYKDRHVPVGIEDIVEADGWDITSLIDERGNWKKNPINPNTATEADYTVLY